MEDHYLCKRHLLPTDSKDQDYAQVVNLVALLKTNANVYMYMFSSFF